MDNVNLQQSVSLEIKKDNKMLVPISMLVTSILMGIGTLIILFNICKDCLKDRVHNKSLHKEFKYIQLFYILACIILLILCTILVIGFYDMLINYHLSGNN